MRKNLARWEAILRMGMGSLLFFFFMIGGPSWSILGIYFMLTGSFRFCPVYYYLGRRST